MLATEISAAKRERDFYMSRVAKAKATGAQKERKLKVFGPFSHQCFSQHTCEGRPRSALQIPTNTACPVNRPARSVIQAARHATRRHRGKEAGA